MNDRISRTQGHGHNNFVFTFIEGDPLNLVVKLTTLEAETFCYFSVSSAINFVLQNKEIM